MKLTKHFLQAMLALALVGFIGQTGKTVTSSNLRNPNRTRYVIQTDIRSPYQIATLGRWLTQNEFDVAGMNWRKGQVEVITNDEGVQKLGAKGLKGYVYVEAQQMMGGKIDSRYLTPATLEAKLKAVAAANPSLTHLEQIGTSLQGRPIWALLVSTTPNPNDPKYLAKPSIMFDGEHHAREIMTPEVVADVADVLLQGFKQNQRVHQLLNNWNVWLIPMVNPDGANIVFTSDNMWRKNARSGAADGTYGVDINRNYTFQWNACHGSSGSTGAQDYHGTSAGSEPETQAMMKFAEKIRPTASLSYHSYSELVLYSYGCKGELTGEKEMVERIGNELAAHLPTDDGKGNYTPGAPWAILYDVDGDSMDHIYAATGALSYTFEINQDFQPPYSVREPTLVKHRGAWGYFLNRIDQNLATITTVDGKTGKAVPAIIAIDKVAHAHGEVPFQSNAIGKFFKVLDPGSYVISAKLADGRVGQATVQMAGKPQEVTVNVQ